MNTQRRIGAGRPVTLAAILLMSSALIAPAFAQIEEVVVTAQKKTEDIQTVPIAVTAFTAQDIAAHQIQGFRDLQFDMPNVNFSNGTFGASNFQIRGIGSAAVTTSGDAGVSVNLNEVYLANPTTTTSATYYDVERIEVSRGPQGTLFGQNATGGSINVITKKPDLSGFGTDLEATYGNLNDEELRGMVNIPIITDQLGVRLAGFWEKRDGDITNVYPKLFPGSGLPDKLDSRDDWSVRGSARWQPTDSTTVDLMYSHSYENDSRVRAYKQGCTTDPSGILGCLPHAITYQNINLNATTNTLLLSDMSLLGSTPFQLFQITGPDYQQTGASAFIPNDPRKVNTDFQPVSTGADDFGSLTITQKIFSWLSATFIGAFDHTSGHAQQATEGTPGDPFSLYGATGTNPASFPADCASPAVLATQRGAYACGAAGYAVAHSMYSGTFSDYYLPAGTTSVQAMQAIFTSLYPTSGGTYFFSDPSYFGKLPISAPVGYGLSSGSIADYSDHMQGYDQIGGYNGEKSLELRFASDFEGPLNFLVGVSHLEYHDTTRYYVAQTGIDLASILFGALQGPPEGIDPNFGDGILAGPSVYDSNNIQYQSRSSGIFGEVYYDIIPNELKLTLGARYTTDTKTNLNQQSTLSCPVPIGSSASDVANILASDCPANEVNPFGTLATTPLYQKAKFDATTGRAVLQWMPKVDFTDQTMIYASYSHGNRPGGFNPPSFIPGLIPNTFAPENVDAYEVGTKNTLLDGSLQANLTGWYYDYKGYQISSIVNRSSLNLNINSTLYGLEGEFLWVPDEHWAFNFNFGVTQSNIGAGNDMQFDTRNPTHGNADAIVLKDFQGSNCVIQNASGPITVAQMNTLASTLSTALHLGFGPNVFVAPPVPLPGSVASASAFINGSATGASGLTCATLGDLLAAMNTYESTNFVVTPSFGGHYNTPGGIPVSVKGNEMPNTPPVDISLGAQYTFDFKGGYTLIPRLDYYWKSQSYSTIFNTAQDKIRSWDEVNAQIQLNGGDGMWYARAWVKNLADSKNITGSYTGADAQGLFTNLFFEEPRTYGLTLGAHF